MTEAFEECSSSDYGRVSVVEHLRSHVHLLDNFIHPVHLVGLNTAPSLKGIDVLCLSRTISLS